MNDFSIVPIFILLLLALFIIIAIFRAVRIVPQSYAIIVERLGKFQAAILSVLGSPPSGPR